MELVRAEGAAELLTSYVPGPGGPAGFYERPGFVPTGDLDEDGEVIMRLALRGQVRRNRTSALPEAILVRSAGWGMASKNCSTAVAPGRWKG